MMQATDLMTFQESEAQISSPATGITQDPSSKKYACDGTVPVLVDARPAELPNEANVLASTSFEDIEQIQLPGATQESGKKYDNAGSVLVDSEALPAKLPNRGSQLVGQSTVHKMDSIFLQRPTEETTVDEMKIQTMYKMVEDVCARIQGKEVQKKILYLTNKQANLFNEQAMQRCIQALDIGDPKFVIKLLPSCGVESQMRIAHTEHLDHPQFHFKRGQYKSSELDRGDDAIVQSQILLLMRTCILPIAKQTRAIILVGGANDCYLSAALSNVVLAEQTRLGKDCPFTVIATVSEYEIHSRAVSVEDCGSLSGQLARGSKSWSARMPLVHTYMTSLKGTMQRCDLTPAASRYLVFECIDENISGNVKNSNAKTSFEAVFLQCLTRKLPSIAIQSHMADLGIATLNELAARNIPVFLLDSTERAITLQRSLQTGGMHTRLAEESDAFPLVSRSRLKKLRTVGDSLTFEGRQELMDIAFEMVERKWQCLIKYGIFDALDTSFLSFMHSALRLGVRMDSTSGEKLPLFARAHELERLQRSNKDSTKSQIPPELAAKAISFILSRCKALEKLAELSMVEKWLEGHDPEFDKLILEAIEHRDQLKPICSDIQAAGGIIKSPPVAEEWLQLFDILTSTNTYSGSIHDLDGIKRILGSVAKLDRLPASNSLESLRTLQDAWDFQELCHQNATFYKYVCKVTYLLLLLIGMGLTALSLAECHTDDFFARDAVLAASVVGTAISAYVAYTNPGQKWQHLRAAAMAIESNIWMFRTRAGPYRTSGPSLNLNADQLLSSSIRDIKAIVVEGADMKLTSFFSISKLANKHGQHANLDVKLGVRKAVPRATNTKPGTPHGLMVW
jgi:hypothetical protein